MLSVVHKNNEAVKSGQNKNELTLPGSSRSFNFFRGELSHARARGVQADFRLAVLDLAEVAQQAGAEVGGFAVRILEKISGLQLC